MSDRIQVMNKVKVPDGRIGTVTMFDDRTVVNNRATEAKVLFDDHQHAYFRIVDLTRVWPTT